MLRPGLVIIALWVVFWLSWLAAAARGTIPGLPGAPRKVPMLVPFGPR